MIRRRMLLVVLCLLLAGCASKAYLEGRELIGAGRAEEGLAALAEAVAAEPDKREYRAYYMRQRELALGQIIAEAEASRATGRLELAETQYLRALRIDPASARAQSGINELVVQRRLVASVREGDDFFRKGDLQRAEARARTVLAENPNHAEARALLLRVEQRRQTDPPPLGVNSPFAKPITLEFRDAPLRGVFETMSRLAGVNFVFDRDVRQDLRVTIFVRNTSIDEVMRLILSTNQLERKLLNENSVLIYPATRAC